jgi:N-acetylmuramate 1-kinase
LNILDTLESPIMSNQAKLENWLTSQGIATDFSLRRLAGDGSTRSFYRLSSKKGSFIVLHDPEWTLSQDYPRHQKFLKERGLPVPAFYETDPKAGVLMMEDLGDELLQFRLLAKPADKMSWLHSCAALLSDLHGKTYPVPKDLPVSTRSFDEQKYFDEMGFTLEHLHEKYLGLPAFSDTKKRNLRNFCGKLASFRPLVFCHRDYHTRNLLLHREKLVMIDFQDARLGSPHYDVASLLYDAYVPVTESERRQLFETYKKGFPLYPLGKEISWDRFEEELSWVAYQRTIKAAGSFASFFTRYGKKTHLPYLIPLILFQHSSLLWDYKSNAAA